MEEKPATLERTDSQTDTIDIDSTDTANPENASRSTEKQEPGQSGAATPSQQQQENQPARGPDAIPNAPGVTPGSQTLQPTFIGGYPIDVPFEASKLPLDVAIYNSARSAGGDDRIRKYLQAVLVVGGGALTSGMAHALESR